MTTIEVREILKEELGSSVRVVATGPAGENEVAFATILADEDAVGCSGVGAVMGSKKLKAVAVRGSGKVKVADPNRFRELTGHIRELTRRSGVTVLPELTNDAMKRMKRGYCYGCKSEGFCDRFVYRAQNGREGKFMCGAAAFYVSWSQKYHGEWNDVPFFATKLCDDYGLDTSAVSATITWLSNCLEAGILTDENTGIPLSKIGSLEFIETLVKRIAFKEGFGETLAQGSTEAANSVGARAKELIGDSTYKGQTAVYSPRTYITTGLLWAMEPRRPIQQLHEVVYVASYPWMDWVNKSEHSYLSTDAVRAIAKKFWGSELAADFSTYEGKALAAKKIQDRRMVEESLILCDLYWPVLSVEFSEDHVGDPSLESKLLSAVTGKEVDEEGLYAVGERIWNLQRAILIREGDKGRKSDTLPEFWYTRPVKSEIYNPECLVPGKGGEIVSKRGAVVDREKFEKMKDEYYLLRGWDVATGLQTGAKLEQIGLQDIVADLEGRELLIE
jgi:aldehyde:ferredoxin oxidoreductase